MTSGCINQHPTRKTPSQEIIIVEPNTKYKKTKYIESRAYHTPREGRQWSWGTPPIRKNIWFVYHVGLDLVAAGGGQAGDSECLGMWTRMGSRTGVQAPISMR